MNIIGLTAFHGASSAALLQNGVIVAALREESLSRVPWDRRLPINAFRACLDYGKLANPSQIDAVAFYRNPLKKLQRQLESGTDHTLDSQGDWQDPLRIESEIRKTLAYDGPVYYFDYLETFVAPPTKEESALLSLCAIGDHQAMAWGVSGTKGIEWSGYRPYPHSPDFFLSLICQFLGFDPLRDESKVFALSLKGQDRFQNPLIRMHKSLLPETYEIDRRYGQFSNSQRLYSQAFIDLIGCLPRSPNDDVIEIHFDIAASAIALYEKVLVGLLAQLPPSAQLRLASQAGRLVLSDKLNLSFPSIHFTSPSDEVEGAIGAARLAWQKLDGPTAPKSLKPYELSPAPSKLSIERTLKASGMSLTHIPGDTPALARALVDRLLEHKSIALFQGLDLSEREGARVILCNPLDQEVFTRLNRQGKKVSEIFGSTVLVLDTYANTHWEGSDPRLWRQTHFPKELRDSGLKHCSFIETKPIRKDVDPLIHALLSDFFHRTGCAFVLAMPFAVGSEPIVAATEDAIRSMVKSQLDTLAIDDYILDKGQIPLSLRKPPTTDPMERGETRANHPLLIQRPERLRPAEGMLPRGINLFL